MGLVTSQQSRLVDNLQQQLQETKEQKTARIEEFTDTEVQLKAKVEVLEEALRNAKESEESNSYSLEE